MKTYKKYLLSAAVLSLAVLTGCKDKMRELNSNPDLISETLPEYMFLGATKNWGWFSNGWARNRAGAIGATMQVSLYNGSSGSYVNPIDWSGGGIGSGSYSNFYSRYYAGGSSAGGRNLNSICTYIDQQLSATDKPRYQDIRAIARVLQMHEAWNVFTNFGAMVFNEAFKIREGITFPTYDVYSKESGLYKQLDDSVKMCIAQLSTPINPEAVALGAQDGFYGFTYTTRENGGASWTVNSPEVQRGRWLKFATTLRVKMAVSMRNVDPEFYNQVMTEVRQQVTNNPNALMSEVQDGCQFVLPDASYDRNENNQLSFWYGMPVSYVNSMKQVEDPRLPLVANMNYCDTSLSVWYKFIATYFPDSLETTVIRNSETNVYERRSWGDVLKMGNVFQGQTSNPANSGETFGPGTLLKGMSRTLTIRHPDWQDPNAYGISAAEKAAREAHNSTLESAQLLNHFTGQVETAVLNGITEPTKPWKGQNGSRSSSIRIASGLQSRHYVMNTGSGGWTGPSWDYDNDSPAATNIKMVTKVLPYAEHCFLMALICNYDGGTIGSRDAEGWYNEGIRASMQETVEDAERVYVKVCTNSSFPTVAGVNADADGSNKRLYKIDYNGADFTNYIAKPQVAFTGSMDEKTNKIMIQMWLANWQKPENTWFYYKLTGYPHTVNYNWETPNEAAMPTQLGLEQPYNSEGQMMVFPRRVVTPQPQVENMPNWYIMRDALEAQTNPSYAPHGWNDNSGRVFWDVIEPAGLY